MIYNEFYKNNDDENFPDIDLDDIDDINKYIEDALRRENGENIKKHNEEVILKEKKINIKEQDLNIIKEFFCDVCKKGDIIEDSAGGILVCKNCGNVKSSSIINFSYECSNYGDGKKEKSKMAHPISNLLPQSSAATVISGSCSNRIKTIHNWNNVPYKERSLNETFKIIHEMCLKINVSKCIEDSAKIKFKRISDCVHNEGKNIGKSIIIRGDNRKSLIVKCLMEACNEKDIHLPPKKIVKHFGVKHTKGGKIFEKLMGIKNIKTKIKVPKPSSYIERFCNSINLMKKFKEQSLKISKNVQKIQIASVHNSLSIATGSIYLMAQMNDLDIQKKTIAAYFCVSQVTISKTYHKIEPFGKILLNNELCDVIKKEIDKYQKNIEIKNPYNFIRFGIDTKKHLGINKSELLKIYENNKINKKKVNALRIINTIEINKSNSEFFDKSIKIKNDKFKKILMNLRT